MESVDNEIFSFSNRDIPEEFRESFQRLETLTKSQQEEIETLKQKNQRLETKLKNCEAYNEELREQIKSLSEKIRQPAQKTDSSASQIENTDWDVAKNENGEVDHKSIVDQIKEAASEVARNQFLKDMVYEATSGLYYDYKSGYYFDAERSLYYDGNTGTYYSYNYDTSTYEIHSQLQNKEKKTKKKSKSRKKEKIKLKLVDELVDANLEAEGSISDVSSASINDKNDDQSDQTSGTEEGEISSSCSSETEEEKNSTKSEMMIPCMRLIVVESVDVRVGTLFIITCCGGSVGREGQHDVLLADEAGCSKVHARISHKEDHYYVTDLGSSNGTFVNGDRLSEKKTESSPRLIGHGTLIQIGSTKLLCHVHPGRETCFECEPGLLQKPEPKNYLTEHISKETSRKRGLKAIKKKYAIGGSGSIPSQDSSRKYRDRADKRRRQVGSDNPYEKTEASHVDKSIDSKNKGFLMLKGMGWQEGSGLGKESSGRTDPVPLQMKVDRAGLGDTQPKVSVDFKSKQKSELWQKTQARFKASESRPAIFTEQEVDD